MPYIIIIDFARNCIRLLLTKVLFSFHVWSESSFYIDEIISILTDIMVINYLQLHHYVHCLVTCNGIDYGYTQTSQWFSDSYVAYRILLQAGIWLILHSSSHILHALITSWQQNTDKWHFVLVRYIYLLKSWLCYERVTYNSTITYNSTVSHYHFMSPTHVIQLSSCLWRHQSSYRGSHEFWCMLDIRAHGCFGTKHWNQR